MIDEIRRVIRKDASLAGEYDATAAALLLGTGTQLWDASGGRADARTQMQRAAGSGCRTGA